ncbi:hypothetical protein N431DRAFT_534108, partial [Stipitochalara longipes BDJ]
SVPQLSRSLPRRTFFPAPLPQFDRISKLHLIALPCSTPPPLKHLGGFKSFCFCIPPVLATSRLSCASSEDVRGLHHHQPLASPSHGNDNMATAIPTPSPWDHPANQQRLARCSAQVLPTISEWFQVSTRDWRATPQLFQPQHGAIAMPTTDKMTEYGVLAYSPSEDEPGLYLGNIGKLDDWTKMQTPKAGVRLVMGNPADGSTYVALSFKIPRMKGRKWTFGDATDGLQRYHQAHLRFHADDFEMRFRVLNATEIASCCTLLSCATGKRNYGYSIHYDGALRRWHLASSGQHTLLLGMFAYSQASSQASAKH